MHFLSSDQAGTNRTGAGAGAGAEERARARRSGRTCLCYWQSLFNLMAARQNIAAPALDKERKYILAYRATLGVNYTMNTTIRSSNLRVLIDHDQTEVAFET